MAYERKPDDLTRSPDDPNRSDLFLSNLSYEDMRRQARLDDDLQMNPDLAGNSASGVKLAMFAIAVAVVFGAIFYGLNTSSTDHAGTSSTAQNTQSSPPAAPPGMRDVTPRRGNTDQGVTTGTAPASPQTPPAAAPTEMNRSGNPPTGNAPSK